MEIYSKNLGSPAVWTSGAVSGLPQAPLVCRTVVTDLGPPAEPEYVLTQASQWTAGPDGRARAARQRSLRPDPSAARRAPERSDTSQAERRELTRRSDPYRAPSSGTRATTTTRSRVTTAPT